MRAPTRLALLLLLVLPAGCADDGRPELWIYTSIYPEVIRRLEPLLERACPEARLRWYQKGSEQVAARLNVEYEAGESPCDLLLTSDPFYYAQLKAAGKLLPYVSPAAAGVPATLRDPDDFFVTVRIPLMVMAVNRERLQPARWPRSFRDLTAGRLAGKVAMGDPLKSGTTFTTVASWVRTYDWPWIEALRGNDVVAAGGNSSVLHKLETGERPVGVILLENLLPSLAKGAPIEVVYPADGAVPVPSPIAILRSTDQPALARRVYDAFFSPDGQAAIVAGSMYSPLPDQAPPQGARAWSALTLQTWDNEFLAWAAAHRDAIKKRFHDVMRR